MKQKRASAIAPILAALLIVAVPSGAYVGGYFWLGQRYAVSTCGLSPAPDYYVREYPHRALGNLYWPAGKVESWWSGEEILVWGPDEE